MKRTVIFLTASAVLAIFACQEMFESKINPRTDFVFSDAGEVHNAGLDEIDSYNYDWQSMSRATGLETASDIIIPFLEDATGYEIGEGNFATDVAIVLDDMTYEEFEDDLVDLSSEMVSISGLNSHETSLKNRMVNLFNMNFSGLSDDQVGSRLIDSFNVYKALIHNSSNYKNEFKAGVHLGYSSVSYWNNWPGDTGGEIEAWGQVDLVGFLIGWMNAYIDEQGPGFDSSMEGQERRIGKGIQLGLGVSMIRMVAVGGRW